MNSFLGKIKDIIGGGQMNYSENEMEIETPLDNISMEDNAFSSFSEENHPPRETVRPSRTKSRYSEKSSEKINFSSPSYSNLDNNVSNDYPNNIIGMPGANNMVSEVVVIEPHTFDEVPKVITILKEQRSVVLNLNVMDPTEAQRAIDFVAGGTFAIDGNQERIGESIFLFTPRNVKVSNISGQSYKNNQETEKMNRPFANSLWDEDSDHLVMSSFAQ